MGDLGTFNMTETMVKVPRGGMELGPLGAIAILHPAVSKKRGTAPFNFAL